MFKNRKSPTLSGAFLCFSILLLGLYNAPAFAIDDPGQFEISSLECEGDNCKDTHRTDPLGAQVFLRTFAFIPLPNIPALVNCAVKHDLAFIYGLDRDAGKANEAFFDCIFKVQGFFGLLLDQPYNVIARFSLWAFNPYQETEKECRCVLTEKGEKELMELINNPKYVQTVPQTGDPAVLVLKDSDCCEDGECVTPAPEKCGAELNLRFINSGPLISTDLEAKCVPHKNSEEQV